MLIPYNSSLEGVPVEIQLSNLRWIYFAMLATWLGGIVVITVMMAARYARFCHMIKRFGDTCVDETVLEHLRNARFNIDALDIKPEVIICPFIHSPMAVGIKHRKILLPTCDYDGNDLEAIFRHELIHCLRYDVLRKLMMLAVCVLHWFNPCAWLMARELGMEMEFACDTAVVTRSGKRYSITYGQTILNSVAREIKMKQELQSIKVNVKTPFASAALNGDKAFLKQRIQNVVSDKKEQGGTFVLCIFFAAIFIMPILFSFRL